MVQAVTPPPNAEVLRCAQNDNPLRSVAIGKMRLRAEHSVRVAGAGWSGLAPDLGASPGAGCCEVDVDRVGGGLVLLALRLQRGDG